MIIKLALELLSKPELATGAIECALRLIFNAEVRKHVLTIITIARIRVKGLGRLRRLATAKLLRMVSTPRRRPQRRACPRFRVRRRAAAPPQVAAKYSRSYHAPLWPGRHFPGVRVKVKQRLK